MSRINVAESISVIGKEIEEADSSHFSQRKKNQRIELKTYDNICYLSKGGVSIYRVENNMLTLSISAPAILGLAQMRNETKSHYLRCDSDCDMWVINTQDAISLFNKNNLWMHAFDILTRHLQMYFHRENMLSPRTIKGIVIEHLKHIWIQPPDIRQKISVYTFILTRNQVSRSAVHKVIQELIAADKVKISRGKLLWLHEEKTLPHSSPQP